MPYREFRTYCQPDPQPLLKFEHEIFYESMVNIREFSYPENFNNFHRLVFLLLRFKVLVCKLWPKFKYRQIADFNINYGVFEDADSISEIKILEKICTSMEKMAPFTRSVASPSAKLVL